MNRKIQIIIVTFITLLLLAAVPAQAAGGVEITFTPDRNELTIGDPVRLTLEIKHPAGYQVIIPKLEQAWGDFEVRSQSQTKTIHSGDSAEITRQTIEVTLFAPGTFQTPPLPLTVSDDAGQISQEMVPPVSLTVMPVLAEGDDTLLDIKPQAQLAVPPRWPWIVAGLLAAFPLLWAGWWLYRRLRGRQQFSPALVIDTRPPYQVAYDELVRIESLKLLEQGQFKNYYTLVTDCLRRYLEKQHHVRAFDRTTSELKLTLRQSALSPEHVRQFSGLFAESDLVKFARFSPEFELACQLTEQARILVAATCPNSEVESATEMEASLPTSLDGRSALPAQARPFDAARDRQRPADGRSDSQMNKDRRRSA